MTDQDDRAAETGLVAPGEGLAEAQMAAIEGAFLEHDRLLSRLRRELEDLRARPEAAALPDGPSEALEQRLAGIEARLDRQDQALRHVLQRLIAFFESNRSVGL